MAFAMPPPISPTGFGIWVKKSKLTAPSPWRATKKSRNPSGASASPTERIEKATTSRETRRRRHRPRGTGPGPLTASRRLRHGGRAPRDAALRGGAPDEEPRQHVDHDGDDEQ